ncbi:hypothetical protein FS749_008270 [Ceratobasidium sp. UAMH 11750]|nr:hypothetical protein FS749_008270 [Ceratobasidium sp. UAMH 11750]
MTSLVITPVPSSPSWSKTRSSVGFFIHNLFASQKVPSNDDVGKMISTYLATVLSSPNLEECRTARTEITRILQYPCYKPLRQKILPILSELDEFIQNMETLDRIMTEEYNPPEAEILGTSTMSTGPVREELPEQDDAISIAGSERSIWVEPSVGNNRDPELAAFMRRVLPV